MSERRIYRNPKEVGVPVRTEGPLSIDVFRLHTGGVVRCRVVQKKGELRATATVFAHEVDVELMDLSMLRLDGKECLLGLWEPKPPTDPIDGPILQLSLMDQGPVELSAAMPRWEAMETFGMTIDPAGSQTFLGEGVAKGTPIEGHEGSWVTRF
ncbi:hypothetical protein B2G69_24950 [Methylorubrum zatmanii]|nr:hypothetical protein [Methylorubrum zatmanii]ARO57092.1 hypothetical protein B2G69_24950 [Methylorubrum zatmanii]